MRLFVGDIQGCLEPLGRLLAEAGFRRGHDILHPVGDLVAKGPDSQGVLSQLMDLGAQPVVGNHDLKWLERGKIQDEAHERWLREQPAIRLLEDPGLILVHAGLHPHWREGDLLSLTPDEVGFAVTVRYCDPEGRRPSSDWPPPPLPYEPWDTYYTGDKRVVFGHWARRGLVRTDRVIGLDTGCVYGGQMTGWWAEEDRLIQVPGLEVSN